ncbi:MAG TPA: hypothetical protein VFE51_16325, partial [Verrucomicrobiae bacterium]|nr:hypothetical protein [Verrucomicrobiae bacterium]
KAPHSGALQNLRKSERRRNFAKRFGVRRSAPLLEPNDGRLMKVSLFQKCLGAKSAAQRRTPKPSEEREAPEFREAFWSAALGAAFGAETTGA